MDVDVKNYDKEIKNLSKKITENKCEYKDEQNDLFARVAGDASITSYDKEILMRKLQAIRFSSVGIAARAKRAKAKPQTIDALLADKKLGLKKGSEVGEKWKDF